MYSDRLQHRWGLEHAAVGRPSYCVSLDPKISCSQTALIVDLFLTIDKVTLMSRAG